MSYLFTIKDIHKAVYARRVIWTTHIADQIHDRGFKRKDVYHIIVSGEVIETHPQAKPLPKCLILGYLKDTTPLYISVGYDKKRQSITIITGHWQDENIWYDDRTRKRR